MNVGENIVVDRLLEKVTELLNNRSQRSEASPSREAIDVLFLERMTSDIVGETIGDNLKSSTEIDFTTLDSETNKRFAHRLKKPIAVGLSVGFHLRNIPSPGAEGKANRRIRIDTAADSIDMQMFFLDHFFTHREDLLNSLVRDLPSFETLEELRAFFIIMRLKELDINKRISVEEDIEKEGPEAVEKARNELQTEKTIYWTGMVPKISNDEVAVLRVFWQMVSDIMMSVQKRLPDCFLIKKADVWKNIALTYYALFATYDDLLKKDGKWRSEVGESAGKGRFQIPDDLLDDIDCSLSAFEQFCCEEVLRKAQCADTSLQ